MHVIAKQFQVSLSHHEYPIYIGKNFLTDIDFLKSKVADQQICIVTNDAVAPYYLSHLTTAFSDFQCDVVILPDGEAHKTQASINLIYDKLLTCGHHRDTTLVALGGGVVGDMTGFAASTYQRGVRLIQIPTSLLAQVDAAIGGKTGINHPQGKNMIGSFYQPDAVIIDLNTLATLPEREFRAGLAEVLKYGLLTGGDMLNHITQLLQKDRFAPQSSLDARWVELIAQCCHIKAKIIEDDEREAGGRALLNLGHTFAHALETYTHYQRWLHGEAVAIGLYCAALLSYQLGYLDKNNLDFIDSLLKQAKLPHRIPYQLDLNHLHQLLFNDKKVKNQQLRFILMKAPGECFIEDKVPEHALKKVLDCARDEREYSHG